MRIWRDSRSLPKRFYISWLATQNWSNWRNMHPDGRGVAERFHLSHVVRRVYEILKELVYLSQQIREKCTDETPIRLQRSINKGAPSPPWVWRRATCTDSFMAVSEMTSVVFFIQHIMVAVERFLVELIKFIKVKHLWAREMSGITERGHLLQLTGGVNSTLHTSHFLVEPQWRTWLKLKFGVRSAQFTSSHASCAHVVCLIFRDFSPVLFLLSTFSPIVFFIDQVFSFFFQDVVEKDPVHSRSWGPWHPCRVRPSHTK